MPRFPVVVVNVGPPVTVEDYDPPEQLLADYTDDDFRLKAIAVVRSAVEG